MSDGKVESDLAWASTLTLTGVTAEVVDRINARFNPRCRVGVGSGAAQHAAPLLAGQGSPIVEMMYRLTFADRIGGDTAAG